MSIRTPSLLHASLAALALAACGGADPQSQPLASALDVRLAIEPDPPVLGRNALLVDVLSPDGEPAEGCAITYVATMPAHAHGAPEQPAIEPLGGGRYRLAPVTFHMVGEWRVTVRADDGVARGEALAAYPIR